MPKYQFIYEPDMEPRMSFQKTIDTMARDLDRIVVARPLPELISWTESHFQQVFTGVHHLGPVKRGGGAIIFLGDTGDLLIRAVK